MEKIVSLCKRRGLIFQSSEIYGGLNSCWDYGPLGIELKNAIRNIWWKEMTQLHQEIVGIDASILMHPRVWEASGHVEGFTDPMVDCKECKSRFRADFVEQKFECTNCGKVVYFDIPDEIREEMYARFGESAEDDINGIIAKLQGTCPNCSMERTITRKLICPKCQSINSFTELKNFNLMFKTFMGPVEESAAMIYLRPETAQGIYVNYLTVMNASRLKPPFGIAQTGKAFRNEITPGNFIFRTREFEQMEMQYFVHPSEADAVFETWMNKRMEYYYRLGINKDKLRFYEHPQNKLAHYAKRAVDIEYEFPWGWGELEGVHNRTDFDLRRHQEYSGKDLTYFDEQSRERYLPYIIETASGLNRTLLVTLLDGYEEEQLEKETRTVLKFSPHIAPMQVGIFPLVKKGGLPEIAKQIEADLRPYYRVFFDQKGAIGRRYRRQDEVGTPFCITVDFDSLEDETVTLRERDSLAQDRYKMSELKEVLWKKMEG